MTIFRSFIHLVQRTRPSHNYRWLGHPRPVLYSILILLIGTSLAYGQSQITVVGSGAILWTQQAPSLTDVQSYEFRFYIPSDSPTPTLVSFTCAAQSTRSDQFDCRTPLTNLPLTSQFQRIALTSGITAADGTVESIKTLSDFVIRRIGPPSAPSFPVIPITK